MTEKCVNAEVRDALPDFLNGRLSALDTATMNAHVESCAECRAELELLAAIRRAAPLAPAMDAARIASAVPAYGVGPAIGTTPARTPAITRSGLFRVAAAALIVIAGSWALTRSGDEGVQRVATTQQPAPAQPTPASVAASPEVTAGATATQPGQAGEVQVASLSLVGITSELSDADLEQLVTDLEGMDAVPSAEPQSVTTTIDDIGTDQ